MTPDERAEKALQGRYHISGRMSERLLAPLIAQQIEEAVQVATKGACGCRWGADGGMASTCDFHMDQAQEIENLKARLE